MPEIYSTKIVELNSRDKDFAGFKWVLKAVDFGRITGVGEVVNISLDGIAATDGHRIHIYSPIETFPAGIFKILSKRSHHLILASAEYVKFPEYGHVLPDSTLPVFKGFDMTGVPERDYAILMRNMENTGLSFKYFSDVGAMDIMYIGPEQEGIMFEGLRKKAVVMPMSL